MDTYDMTQPAMEPSGIGTAVLCDDRGNPVVTRFSADDDWNLVQLQDAEEEPMLRDAA